MFVFQVMALAKSPSEAGQRDASTAEELRSDGGRSSAPKGGHGVGQHGARHTHMTT